MLIILNDGEKFSPLSGCQLGLAAPGVDEDMLEGDADDLVAEGHILPLRLDHVLEGALALVRERIREGPVFGSDGAHPVLMVVEAGWWVSKNGERKVFPHDQAEQAFLQWLAWRGK